MQLQAIVMIMLRKWLTLAKMKMTLVMILMITTRLLTLMTMTHHQILQKNIWKEERVLATSSGQAREIWRNIWKRWTPTLAPWRQSTSTRVLRSRSWSANNQSCTRNCGLMKIFLSCFFIFQLCSYSYIICVIQPRREWLQFGLICLPSLIICLNFWLKQTLIFYTKYFHDLPQQSKQLFRKISTKRKKPKQKENDKSSVVKRKSRVKKPCSCAQLSAAVHLDAPC